MMTMNNTMEKLKELLDVSPYYDEFLKLFLFIDSQLFMF